MAVVAGESIVQRKSALVLESATWIKSNLLYY